MTRDELQHLVRTIPDHPEPGILFRDVTTLLLHAEGFAAAIDQLADSVSERPDLVAGMEARGFVVATALALKLATIAEDYALEYGTDRLTMHVDACAPGATVLLADDLIATGGTALAAARLVKRAGGVVSGARFLIDLPDLGGAAKLEAAGVATESLLAFPGH
jgi:adenine phosphoribosyltransferase